MLDGPLHECVLPQLCDNEMTSPDNSPKQCEVCGCPVKVVGHTTLHYEIDIEKLFPQDIYEPISRIAKDDMKLAGQLSGFYLYLRDYVKARLEGEQ